MGRKKENKKKTTSEEEENVKVKEGKEEEVAETERHARIVKSEANVAVRRKGRGKGVVVMEYRPKIRDNAVKKSDRTVEIQGRMNAAEESDRTVDVQGKMVNAVEESDLTVKIERKMVNAGEESDGTVEIEGKFREISVEGQKGGVEKQTKVIPPRNGVSGGYGDGFSHSCARYRGGGGGYGRRSGGGYGRMVHGGEQKGIHNGMAWVRKEEVSAGGSMK